MIDSTEHMYRKT